MNDAYVFLALGATDMRKSINGLSLLVEEQFEMDLFTGNLFAFCNRRQDLVKILYWDGNGFCVWMKRLEEDHFAGRIAKRRSWKVMQAP
nr:IS66 family insertion sequence element accessory protein TnpB [uncultured Desulfobulbus sp.]